MKDTFSCYPTNRQLECTLIKKHQFDDFPAAEVIFVFRLFVRILFSWFFVVFVFSRPAKDVV